MRDQDQQFFDSFMLVIGILIGVVAGLFFLARAVAIDRQDEYVMSDPRVAAQIDERIRPVGRVVLSGDEALQASSQQAAPAPTAPDMPLTGAQVFNQACFACHAPPGIGGAPVIGDAGHWADRIPKGMDVLEQNALMGFQGDTGFMPAKGGRPDLSDQEVIDAVHYMIEQLQGNGSAPAAQ